MVGVSVASALYNHTTTDLTYSAGSSTTSNDKFGISVNPSLGWFINENVAIGFAPVIGYSNQKILGKSSTGSTYLKDKTTEFSFLIGGFSRYYFNGSGSATTRFFGQYNLALGLGSSKSDGFEYEQLGVYVDRYNRKSSGDFLANTGLTLGVSKFLTGKNALDFYIGYNFSFAKSNPTGTTVRDYSDPAIGDITTKPNYDQKVSGHNIIIGVAFQMFLEKKK